MNAPVDPDMMLAIYGSWSDMTTEPCPQCGCPLVTVRFRDPAGGVSTEPLSASEMRFEVVYQRPSMTGYEYLSAALSQHEPVDCTA